MLLGLSLSICVQQAGGEPPTPTIDPATLALSLWVRAPYGGAPWVGVASTGSSGAKNLTTNTSEPDVGAELNGLAGADCDGVNEAFSWVGGTWADVISASAYTFILACVPRSPNAPGAQPYDDALFIGDNGGSVGCGYSTSGFRAFHDDGAVRVTAAVAAAADAFHTVAVRYNGTQIQIRVDGGDWTSVAAGNVGAPGLASSVQFMKNYTTNFANGIDYEVIASQSAFSDETVAGVEAYLLDRYQ
jgi:hypothetical protein